MNKVLRVMLAITLVLAVTPVLVTTGCTSTPAEGIKIGNLAPDFQLPGLDGQTISLRSLRGKPVLLNFWASWCGPCVFEMPFLQEIHEEWSDKGLVLLAINVDESSSQIERFMRSEGLTLPVLLDAKGEVSRKYNVTGIPATFFIAKDGIIESIKIEAFQNKAQIEESLKKISP